MAAHRGVASCATEGSPRSTRSVTSAGDVPARVLASPVGRALHDRPASHRPAAARCGGHRRRGPDGPRQLAADVAFWRRTGTARTRSGHAGWSRTPRRCRSSRSTGARAWSSRSCSSRTPGTAGPFRSTSRSSTIPTTGNERTIDVGCPAARLHRAPEIAGGRGAGREPAPALCRPDPRLPQAVLWWAGAKDTKNSRSRASSSTGGPTARSRRAGRGARRRDSREAFAALGPRVSVERVEPPPIPGGSATSRARSELERRRLRPRPRHDWRRASYSSHHQAAHEQPAIASEPEARRS